MATENNASVPQTPTIIVPIEYAGLWIAWNLAGTHIVASGRTIQEAAEAASEREVIFEKIPKANVRFGISVSH